MRNGKLGSTSSISCKKRSAQSKHPTLPQRPAYQPLEKPILLWYVWFTTYITPLDFFSHAYYKQVKLQVRSANHIVVDCGSASTLHHLPLEWSSRRRGEQSVQHETPLTTRSKTAFCLPFLAKSFHVVFVSVCGLIHGLLVRCPCSALPSPSPSRAVKTAKDIIGHTGSTKQASIFPIKAKKSSQVSVSPSRSTAQGANKQQCSTQS